MNHKVLYWLKENSGNAFSPLRPKSYPIRITAVDEEREELHLEFVGGSQSLPLYFWMFDRAITYLRENRARTLRLGAKVNPPFDEDTVEGQIWNQPYPHPPKSPFKSSPHICDILVLSGLASYEKVKNPETGRSVQGIKNIEGQKEVSVSKPDVADYKDDLLKGQFIARYKETIIKWADSMRGMITDARLRYSWKDRPTSECVKERNEISKAIVLARIKYQGGVDLKTLDKVTRWGFYIEFPLRDEKLALRITKDAFKLLDKQDLVEATSILLNISGVGISRASKILGLFDQENLCIYDSRVGTALKNLKANDSKIILCPPGRYRKGDYVSSIKEWALQYQRLIWVLEIIRDFLNGEGNIYRVSDIEMALFMIGRS